MAFNYDKPARKTTTKSDINPDKHKAVMVAITKARNTVPGQAVTLGELATAIVRELDHHDDQEHDAKIAALEKAMNEASEPVLREGYRLRVLKARQERNSG